MQGAQPYQYQLICQPSLNRHSFRRSNTIASSFSNSMFFPKIPLNDFIFGDGLMRIPSSVGMKTTFFPGTKLYRFRNSDGMVTCPFSVITLSVLTYLISVRIYFLHQFKTFHHPLDIELNANTFIVISNDLKLSESASRVMRCVSFHNVQILDLFQRIFRI